MSRMRKDHSMMYYGRCLSEGLVFNLKHISCDFDCLINQCMHVVAAIYIKNGLSNINEALGLAREI